MNFSALIFALNDIKLAIIPLSIRIRAKGGLRFPNKTETKNLVYLDLFCDFKETAAWDFKGTVS